MAINQNNLDLLINKALAIEDELPRTLMPWDSWLGRWYKPPCPTAISWESLAMQFGSSYSRQRDFKTAFMYKLKKVVTVYGGVQVEALPTGLLVKSSLTHTPWKET